jgi:hypothetical protein
MLKQRAQTTKPKLENHKELPLHTCKLPLNQCNSTWTNACQPLEENRAAASAQSSVLWSWLCGSTKEPQWFSGEPLETPRTRCSLRQSPLMPWLPLSPSSTLVLRLYQETVHDFILLFMPPCGPHLTPLATGSLERSLLVFSTPGGLTGTFRACSSPAPTQVKPQPAPAILSQESVHTTLSNTHHTRKRPSIGPRTTHGPQVSSQYKKDKHCLPAQTQLPTNVIRVH